MPKIIQRKIRIQKLKVFTMNDFDWWVGYSFEDCLAACKKEHDTDCPDYAEDADSTPLSAQALWEHRFHYNQDANWHPFAIELENQVEIGGQFPRLFASTEY